MKLTLSTFTLLPLLLSLTACQSLPEDRAANSTSNMLILPVATAVQIDYQDEVKLLRLNQLIAEHTGDNKEKALLFYERGIIYDRMGLAAHSRYDFTQSINSDPAFPDAYNSYGIYLLLAESYDDAFDAFDASIELSEQMQYSYLHRAIGLYQVKRFKLASDDIRHFYEMDKSDPYRILWRYIIDAQLDEPAALAMLTSDLEKSRDNRYAWSLVDVITGNISERAFFTNVTYGVNSNKEMAQRLCEAYFYLGHWHKLAGNIELGNYYFKLATTTNIHEFIEYKYALMEIASFEKIIKEKALQQRE